MDLSLTYEEYCAIYRTAYGDSSLRGFGFAGDMAFKRLVKNAIAAKAAASGTRPGRWRTRDREKDARKRKFGCYEVDPEYSVSKPSLRGC